MASLQLRRPLNGIGGLSQAVIKHSFFLNIKKENIRPLVFIFFYVDYNRIYVNEKVPIETIIIKKLVQIIFNNTLSVHKFMHTLSGLIICHVHNIV